MAQELIKFNNTVIAQPDEGLGFDFETTYTEDTTRVQSGVLHASPMFTVEAFSYENTRGLTVAEMRTILQIIAKGGRFTMRYFSPYYGQWRNDSFYVGKGSLSVGSLSADGERFDSLAFNIIGVNPL